MDKKTASNALTRRLQSNVRKTVISDYAVEKALSHLNQLKKKKKNPGNLRKKVLAKCTLEVMPHKGVHADILPFSYTYILFELRKCILKHKWNFAAKLLLMLLDGGSLKLKPIMLKSCILTLLHHPKASSALRKEFFSSLSLAWREGMQFAG